MKRLPPARPLLGPLIPLYRLALALRELRLQFGWEPVQRLLKPVVSVGNISTGGAGKTPFTIALARALSRRGIAVDVLSRGYGRISRFAARVDPDGSAAEFGDEPLLIARHTGLPVYVASQRFEAGQMAEAQVAEAADKPCSQRAFAPSAEDADGNEAPCPGTTSAVPQEPQECFDGARLQSRQMDGVEENGASAPAVPALHLLDDGFQHRQLVRAVDIVLVSREDLRDHLLPAGNLREPLSALRRAMVLVIPAEEPKTESALRALGFSGPVWRIRRRMIIPHFPGPVVAFCGIARPEQFFSGLEQAGMDMALCKTFADHHRYQPNDIHYLSHVAASSRATLLTTEKDAARIGALAHLLPPAVQLHTVGLVSEIEDEDAALDWLLARLQ
jgi:tetraacyldisaccharide 4'-kinase